MKYLVLLMAVVAVLGQIEMFRKTKNRVAKANSAGKFSMDNEQDFQYYAHIGIGTPAQTCKIVFDTGSNEFWVSTIWGDYQSSQSSTYSPSQNPGNITYGRGYVSGYYGTEMISISQVGISNLKQQMIFVDQAEEMGHETDGLLGLTNDKQSPNWLDLAQQAGQLPDAQFAFDLRNQDKTTYFYASSQSFPSSEQLTWVNVDMQYYWAISVKSTTVNGQTQPQDYSSSSAVVDTGTSLLLMGGTGYNMLMNAQSIQQCQYDSQSGIYVCSCSGSYPTITFNADAYKYLAVPSDYMINLQGGYCALGVQSNQGLGIDLMIFGDSLMRNYFVAYDKTRSKVGFSAPESQKAKGFLN